MFQALAEWIIPISFFLLVTVSTIGEVGWLSRKNGAGFGKSLGFSVLSNFIGLFFGFLVFIVIAFIVWATAWNGLTYTKFTPAEEFTRTTIIVAALLFTPFLLIICKRLGLWIFQIQKGKTAWAYSVAGSVLILVISLGIPALIGYFLYR